MKIKGHIDQELLTYDSLYPFRKLVAQQGPRFTHPAMNRAGDIFTEGVVDVLRSYKGDDVYDYSSRPKTFTIPSTTSIRPTTWPDKFGPAKDPGIDVFIEFDAIRGMATKGSKINAKGLIDRDIVITENKKYSPRALVDPVTGDMVCVSNDWSECEIPRKDHNRLPPRTFVAYDYPNFVDQYGDPEPATMLIYTGETKGIQNSDGALWLYDFVPSPDHPLLIMA
jgi:hypothetical protein